MADILIAGMNVVGALFFFLSVLWAVFNLRAEIAISEFWVIYAAAAVFGGIYLALRAAEWAGIRPATLDRAASFPGLIGITLIITAGTILAISPIKRQVK